MRPFELPATNMIECINQISFTVVILPLLFLTESSDWTDTKEDLYIYGLLIGPFCNSLISFTYLSHLVIKKFEKDPYMSKVRNFVPSTPTGTDSSKSLPRPLEMTQSPISPSKKRLQVNLQNSKFKIINSKFLTIYLELFKFRILNA